MEIDRDLIKKLTQFRPVAFDGSVFRTTAQNFDPIAASLNGGRWAPRPNDEPGFPVLYTSLVKEGAIAEVASYLAMQSPMPSKPLVVHELLVTASKTITLAMADLKELGVDPKRFGHRNYAHTQLIGASINYLGLDGLISPCARWQCQNLTLFMDHHALKEKLTVVESEKIDWRSWAADAGLIDDTGPRLQQSLKGRQTSNITFPYFEPTKPVWNLN